MIAKENQGCVRLGRTKSHHKDSRNSSVNKENPPPNASSKDPFSNTISFNYCSPDQLSQQSGIFSKTHNGFFNDAQPNKQRDHPRNPMLSQFRCTSPLRAISPNQRVVKVMRTVGESPLKLMNKIKILESRVQELHQQRQLQKLKMHEEIKKLKEQSQRVNETERMKNMEIQYLKRQLQNLKEIRKSQISLSGSSKQDKPLRIYNQQVNKEEVTTETKLFLKNKIYVGEQESEELVDKKQETEENDQMKILQLKNEQLQKQLQQTRWMVTQNSKIIEENNQLLIEQYENKISTLEQKVDELMTNQSELSVVQKRAEQLREQMIKVQGQYLKLAQQREAEQKELSKQNEALKSELKNTKKSDVQGCQKCRQLIKNLMKFNNKALSKIQ